MERTIPLQERIIFALDVADPAATPAAAIGDGADYLVIGRPIRDAADPSAMIASILQEIQSALPA